MRRENVGTGAVPTPHLVINCVWMRGYWTRAWVEVGRVGVGKWEDCIVFIFFVAVDTGVHTMCTHTTRVAHAHAWLKVAKGRMVARVAGGSVVDVVHSRRFRRVGIIVSDICTRSRRNGAKSTHHCEPLEETRLGGGGWRMRLAGSGTIRIADGHTERSDPS